MNRLIIIGNGFDLAHKLKTSYNDFMLWYLNKCFSCADEHQEFDDNLLKVERINGVRLEFGKIKTVSDFIDHLYQIDGFSAILNNATYYPLFKGQDVANPFRTVFKFPFFRNLLSKCNLLNWVEIENEYYEELKRILNESSKSTDKVQKLEILNKSFDFVTRQLEEYLKTIQPTRLNSGYKNIFESSIDNTEIVATKIEKHEKPKNTLILNFNYTSTIEHYFEHTGYGIPPKKFDVNYIHGKIDDNKNPIIFGFGDELDADYTKMELEKVNGYFNHIKSFGYFRTSNYHDLIRFIESDQFQVFVLGHSCGLSDRTMLNMIFEHENCMSIKIFYFTDKNGVNNFTTLTQEISRHFRNKAAMRKKIVPFEKSIPMPQL